MKEVLKEKNQWVGVVLGFRKVVGLERRMRAGGEFREIYAL